MTGIIADVGDPLSHAHENGHIRRNKKPSKLTLAAPPRQTIGNMEEARESGYGMR
ncbi:MAG: hypothetical protein KDB03_08690 [Planctomycetales bacterium]|nr:hypothetical protein [Planctomycetales bacterium]